MRHDLTALTLWLLLAAFVDPVAAEALHPRLFFNVTDMPALQQKIAQYPWSEFWSVMQSDFNCSAVNGGDDYSVTEAAQHHGFMYPMTGDDLHCACSRNWTAWTINNQTGNKWADPGTKGLELYIMASHVAIAYDFCWGSPSFTSMYTPPTGAFDGPFQQWVSQQLKAMADVIVIYGGSGQNTDPASNWQGARGSSAGLAYLATDDAYDPRLFQQAVDRAVAYWVAQFGTSATNSTGWNVESDGYEVYPFQNDVGPFALAALHTGTLDVRNLNAAGASTMLTPSINVIRVFGGVGGAGGFVHLDWSDDNPGWGDLPTLAFALAPPSTWPALKWVFNRTHAELAYKKSDNPTADWSEPNDLAWFGILSFPGMDVQESDPMTVPAWSDLFYDSHSNGKFWWRNTWHLGVEEDIASNHSDILAMFYAKLRGNHGHNAPDGLGFRIFGLDNPWAVGGGRYGQSVNNTDVRIRTQTNLYLNDPYCMSIQDYGTNGTIVSPATLHADGSGSVAAAMPLSNLGVTNHTRRFAVDYSGASGVPAAFVIVDSSVNGVWWQMSGLPWANYTFGTLSDARASHTSYPTFLQAGPKGGWNSTIRGAVLFPPSPSVTLQQAIRQRGSAFNQYTDNLNVYWENTDSTSPGNHVVVRTLAQPGQEHPPVTQSGTWTGSCPVGVVTVGSWTVTVSCDSIAG